VGELAERTGLTVRALHHYDTLGLLTPTGRTSSTHGAGHRLYTHADVARLQQIQSLKQLGFTLDEIREHLAQPDYDPRQVVRMHLERVRGQAAELKRLELRLVALANALDKAEFVSADDFLATIEEITVIEKYYTPEQLELLKERGQSVGEDATSRWVGLGARVQAAMEAGLDPADPKAHELAREWFELVQGFTGGDPGLVKSLGNLYGNEERIQGMDVAATWRPMMDYIQKAAKAAGLKMPGA
jgi:DNA-binding transcriptional MerR regulator